jgi:hypothetical protein
MAGAASAGVPARGGEPLLASAESATATVLGTVETPEQVDLHGWAARLRVERVLAGDPAPSTTLRIAWEELSRGRPVRFGAGDRILVALGPLPGASLWSQRFPGRDALAVGADGDAFVREPDAASVETLAAYLALPPEQRPAAPGVEALVDMIARAQAPLARAALARAAAAPDLASRLSPTAREELAHALGDPGLPADLRKGVLHLIGERQLRGLHAAVEACAEPASELAPEALAALAALDGGLSAERVALLVADPDPALRAVGVRYAPGTPSEERLEPLLKSDPDPRVRAAAAEALVASRGGAAAIPVGAALFDPAAEVREAAVRGLASLGAAAVPTLEHLVEDRTAREASAPLAALALAGPSGRAALERVAAAHADEQVRALARAMLGRRARPAH